VYWVLACAVTADAARLELEVSVAGGVTTAKVRTLSGFVRSMTLFYDGRGSACDLGPHDTTLLDTHGTLLHPHIQQLPTGSPCHLDVFFLFRRFRHVTLEYTSIVFDDQPLVGGVACMRGVQTPGLCETHEAGVVVRWFSAETQFYENAAAVALPFTTLRPATSAKRTRLPLVDVDMAHVVAEARVQYDLLTHTLRVEAATPSVDHLTALAVLGSIVAILYVIRINRDDTWEGPWLHSTVLAVPVVAIVVSLAAEHRSLRLPWVAVGVAGLTAVHAVSALAHWYLKWQQRAALLRFGRTAGPTDRLLHWYMLPPDLALLQLGMILPFYTCTSHGLVLLPTFISLLYTSRLVAEFMRSRSVRGLYRSRDAFHRRGAILMLVSMLADCILTGILLRTVVAEFIFTTLVASRRMQTVVVMTLVLVAATMLADSADATAACELRLFRARRAPTGA
jgi:hypothetical protein